MQTINYPELGIKIHLGDGAGAPSDTVTFEIPSTHEYLTIENSLSHQPAGVRSYGTTVGVKPSKKSDFTVITFPQGAKVGAVFTLNTCPSTTIHRNRECIKHEHVSALAVVSGNAVTHAQNDERDILRIAELLSIELDVAPESILINATGKIGEPLNISLFEKEIPGCKSKLVPENLEKSAEAILTTDFGPKYASFKYKNITLCGFCKGAGMIEPNMATMLAYFFTNASVSKAKLQEMLTTSVNQSFNRMSIDTDTSTSDTVALFSTCEVEPSKDELEVLANAIRAMCVKFSRDIATTGEGVEKGLEVTVATDQSLEYSARLAKQVVNSPLVKSAVHGSDPNWGRIAMALGKTPAGSTEPPMNMNEVKILIQGTEVFSEGKARSFDANVVNKAMKDSKLVTIDVTIGKGAHLARVWGSDLSEEYVTFNADYTT